MPAPRAVDARFLHRPFTRDEFVAAGYSDRMLQARRFRRLHHGVWVHRDHPLTRDDVITAAVYAMPSRTRLSHETRIEIAGYPGRLGPTVHFTVADDLHLAVDGVFLHRTEVLPPCDDIGVTTAAAFIQCCAQRSLIEVVKIGDWLLYHHHASREEIIDLARRQRWRPGSGQALAVVDELDDNSWSPNESEVRCHLVHAGLPRPEGNTRLVVAGESLGFGDLWIPELQLVIEVEGRHHLEDAAQVESDIHRYARWRAAGLDYLQVTGAMRRQPIAMVRAIHQMMVRRGYTGPPPNFGLSWQRLYGTIRPYREGHHAPVGSNGHVPGRMAG